ncbi:MAG: nuclease PIN [Oceanospirillaceae bacterium]|nr:nuclease PIN [Oceanospirillaceae bacterium]MBT11521.1 nuclease PIN [Oceanospirillaceae bacterium]|tara:strand:- start:277 stop:1116 length:840 start_codon:yes stop_codon:yes gene_type:complete
MTHSSVEKIIPSHPSSDGDGVKIRRVGLFNQPGADPFLMMDELLSDNPDDFIGGFPPHPHRGMETLTYLIHGSLEHQDHMGNKGLINSGGAQWMSAGRGVIHSEMPAREMKQLHGFQLWINLPAENKMQTPDYRDVSAEEIPQIAGDHWSAKLIAGDWDINGVTGTGPLDKLAAEAAYADIQLTDGQEVSIKVPEHQKVIAFVYQGQLETSPAAPEKSMLIFNATDNLTLKASQDSRLILLRGTPIREPVAHYGPFVMNTMDEIEQAIIDYNKGNFGNG